jgi:hypothetical protein
MGTVSVGLGQDDVAIAFSPAGWRQFLEGFQKVAASNASRPLVNRVRELILDYDEHSITASNEHFLMWKSRQIQTSEMLCMLREIVLPIASSEFLCLTVSPGNTVGTYGKYTQNSFALTTQVRLTRKLSNGARYGGIVDLITDLMVEDNTTVAPPTVRDVANANDHTCVSCGNTACNRTESSCWRCGTAIKPNG